MPQNFLLFILLLTSTFSLSQKQEPRLVLPVGHTDAVESAVFSPDGRLVFTWDGSYSWLLFDVKSGKELKKEREGTMIKSAMFSENNKFLVVSIYQNILDFKVEPSCFILDLATGKKIFLAGYSEYVISASISSNSKFLITAGSDNTARIWEISTGKELKVLTMHKEYIYSAVFSPDGKLALTASSDNTARIYDVYSGKELRVLKGHTDAVYSAVFSPDGKLALTASSDNTARIYDVYSGKELRVLKGHTDAVTSAVFSPDGKLALTASGDNTARIFEVATGKALQVLSGHTDLVRSAVFSPDGKLALTAGDITSRIYDITTGKELKFLLGYNNEVNFAVFSPDGKLALKLCKNNNALIYDMFSGVELQELKGHTENVGSAVFSPNEIIVLTTGDNTAKLWDAKSGKLLQTLEGHTKAVGSAVFSPDGKLALTASFDNTARIFEVATGKVLQVLSGHTDAVNSAVFSPDSTLVLTASDDNTARIFEVATGKALQVLSGHTRSVYSAVFSPDGKLALTASGDSTARIFEVATGKALQVLNGHTSRVYSAVFNSDGTSIVTASSDYTAKLWDAKSGKLLQNSAGHTDDVMSIEYSPDGNHVLTIGFTDSIARIKEVKTGKVLFELRGHKDRVYNALFSSDGKFAITTSSDNTIRIWDVANGKQLQVFSGNTSWITSCEFSSDLKYFLTTSADHKTILWDVETGKPLYTRLQLEGDDWLVYDEDYRFDGTQGAIDYLYLTCGLEVIDLAQVKDSLWVPGLVEKIMNGDSILINDRPAPKLKDLNICELTPVIEPIDKGDKGLYRYKIIPRNGGLGETEVYINGNLTYKFKPEQLQKKLEQKKEVYYLTFSSDTLQGFLTGEKNSANPILVKAKVKGSGIYGRGVVLDVVKNTEKENPKFYGVFIGVNDYGNPNKESSEQRYRDLDFAKKDADDLSNAVEATARNLFKEDCRIYRLTGPGNSESAPTKANIQKALKEIGEKAKASDILYIFFAGHGDIPEKSGEKEIRFILHKAFKGDKKYYFGVEELTEWCHPKNIKAQKRVFVFDACHSGQIINQTMAFNGRGDDEATRIRQLDKLKDKNGMMILAAAADNESAYEDETLNQGVLTYHLLQVMKEQQKDTSLVIRSWFDETIDLVKDYSRANGNKQEPNSFGDGRFEIGNITNEVRQKIDISCPKTRIGMCVIVDPTGEAEIKYPQLKDKVNQYYASTSSRGNLVFSKNSDKAYRIEGTYVIQKKKLQVRYKVFLSEKQQGEAISLPALKNKTEDELVKLLTESITAEIERIDNRKEKCKKNLK